MLSNLLLVFCIETSRKWNDVQVVFICLSHDAVFFLLYRNKAARPNDIVIISNNISFINSLSTNAHKIFFKCKFIKINKKKIDIFI